MTYPEPAACSLDEVTAIARDLFGLDLSSAPKRLPATTGDIFLLRAPEESVLRMSFANETRENLEFQNDVLHHAGLASLPVALPRALPSLNGNGIETVWLGGEQRLVRLMSFVPGHPVSAVASHPALLADAGRCLGLLDLALAGFPRPAPPQDLVWSVDRALDLRPQTALIPSPRAKALAETAFRNFESRVLPRLEQLRRQVIHGDFNTGNVLVDGPGSHHLSGVIDFGDLTSGPMVQDLAIAAARLCNPNDPVPDILAICAGYCAVSGLLPEEREVLFDLVSLREAMRLSHWAGEFARHGGVLSREIEEPGTKTLAALLETDARSRIERCLGTCNP